MTAPAFRPLDPPSLPAPVGNYTHGVEVTGAHRPALTIIITGIYDESWLLEIDAVAAA